MTPEEFRSGFGSEPCLHVHAVDLARDAALIVSLTRETYRSAAFLDDRALTPGTAGSWVPLAELFDASARISTSKPLHFVWHTGHVGSTLVSRLVEEVMPVLSLREPLPLRTLADTADALGSVHASLSESAHGHLSDALLACWARGFADTRCVVMKAPSVTARAAPLLLRRASASSSIYLNLRLEPYVAASLAPDGPPVDLRNYGPERIRRLQARLSSPLPPLWSLSPGELAAMSWLSETLTQHALVAEFGERVLPLDFDDVLADVGGALMRVLAQFGLAPDDTHRARVEVSPVLARHSKSPGVPCSAELRARRLEESRSRHADEIRKGTRWVEQLARTEPAVLAATSRA